MNATPDEAHARALDFLCRQFRESVRLVRVDSLPAPVYDFDPSGWYLFALIRANSPMVLGPDEYVAVSQSTGEVRYLGRVGQ